MDQKLKVICGDAVEELRKLDTESIDLIITDPPYNLNKQYGNSNDNMQFDEYIDFSRKWIEQAVRVLKKNGSIYVFMGMRFISYIYMIMEKEFGLTFNSWITWYYTQGLGKKRGFSSRHDDILFFTKDSKQFTFNLDEVRIPQKYYRSVNNMRGANPGNVWEFSHMHYCNSNRYNHPTQKPEGLIERIVRASSNVGDMVLDPFVGSGTVMRVCQQLGRNAIGIDLNPEYVEMTEKRLAEKFNGFDSVDVRMQRVPDDLNDEVLRKEYIENHKLWFLKNHPESIKIFMDKVYQKYGGSVGFNW